MALTFECGVCHSIYRLDEHQITANGVKITCPKCLNYFFLKKGASEANEAPVVEYVVPDGAYDISEKVEAPVREAARAPQAAPPKEPKRPANGLSGFLTSDLVGARIAWAGTGGVRWFFPLLTAFSLRLRLLSFLRFPRLFCVSVAVSCHEFSLFRLLKVGP